MEILSLEHVSVTYDGIRAATDDISLQIMQGEIICIVGESGSGKSTLLHAVQGLLPAGAAVKGQIRLFGKDLAGLSQVQKRRMRGEQVAMIFQDTGRYMNPIAKIGKQYLSFLKLHLQKPEAELKALQEEMLRKVKLTDTQRVLNSYPFELSGGMRQRVGIAMALSLGPKLLLADEPTSALDVTVQAQVVRELAQLCRDAGTTIIIVTHNMGVAATISDRIGVMQGGRMVEWGTVSEVIQKPKSTYTKDLLRSIIELDDPQLLQSCHMG
ncbi:MAG: ABC transporter ATP-binding protein [Lachnospiraceae bacterium]|nr:ABC transporter ATP-binding protein [Lachnospiraceae bacterium]